MRTLADDDKASKRVLRTVAAAGTTLCEDNGLCFGGKSQFVRGFNFGEVGACRLSWIYSIFEITISEMTHEQIPEPLEREQT